MEERKYMTMFNTLENFFTHCVLVLFWIGPKPKSMSSSIYLDVKLGLILYWPNVRVLCPTTIKVNHGFLVIILRVLMPWSCTIGLYYAVGTINTPLMDRSRVISFLTQKYSLHANFNLSVEVFAGTTSFSPSLYWRWAPPTTSILIR
jgi:hypothetical protein